MKRCSKRRLLQIAAVTGGLSIAGCSESESSDDSGDGSTDVEDADPDSAAPSGRATSYEDAVINNSVRDLDWLSGSGLDSAALSAGFRDAIEHHSFEFELSMTTGSSDTVYFTDQLSLRVQVDHANERVRIDQSGLPEEYVRIVNHSQLEDEHVTIVWSSNGQFNRTSHRANGVTRSYDSHQNFFDDGIDTAEWFTQRIVSGIASELDASVVDDGFPAEVSLEGTAGTDPIRINHLPELDTVEGSATIGYQRPIRELTLSGEARRLEDPVDISIRTRAGPIDVPEPAWVERV